MSDIGLPWDFKHTSALVEAELRAFLDGRLAEAPTERDAGLLEPIADLLRLPYFPITPLFPWLGPVGMVPLPSRWIIEFCPPVPTDGYEPGDETAPGTVADLSGRIRGTIQRKLDDLIEERGPAFG